jgi:hypothetical protein
MEILAVPGCQTLGGVIGGIFLRLVGPAADRYRLADPVVPPPLGTGSPSETSRGLDDTPYFGSKLPGAWPHWGRRNSSLHGTHPREQPQSCPDATKPHLVPKPGASLRGPPLPLQSHSSLNNTAVGTSLKWVGPHMVNARFHEQTGRHPDQFPRKAVGLAGHHLTIARI